MHSVQCTPHSAHNINDKNIFFISMLIFLVQINGGITDEKKRIAHSVRGVFIWEAFFVLQIKWLDANTYNWDGQNVPIELNPHEMKPTKKRRYLLNKKKKSQATKALDFNYVLLFVKCLIYYRKITEFSCLNSFYASIWFVICIPSIRARFFFCFAIKKITREREADLNRFVNIWK